MRGSELPLTVRCDADVNGCDGAEAEAEAEDSSARLSAEEEDAVREQEEEAASRGWSWRPSEHAPCLGTASPLAPLEVMHLPLREAAVAACACPSRSHVLGESGSVYSVRSRSAWSTPHRSMLKPTAHVSLPRAAS